MASAITHFLVGASVGWAAQPLSRRWTLPVACGLWGAAPDLDTWIMQALDIPRGSLFSHRGVFHSPFFLALTAFTLAALLRKGRTWLAIGLAWTIAAITHPLLDMLTDGGSGVMLLFPVTTERLFFPWHPIRVSPLSIGRFFDRAGPILLSELPFILAATLCAAVIFAFRTALGTRSGTRRI